MGAAVDVRWIFAGGLERRSVEDLPGLLQREDGFVWVDIPSWDGDAAEALGRVFGFHPLAMAACGERSHVPRLRTYPDHLFLVLNAPEPGDAGHVHLVELDQFVGLRYLVTVHGPLGVGVPLEAALRETNTLVRRIEEKRFLPRSPAELSHALVSAVVARMENLVTGLASKVALMERRVMENGGRDPEADLEEMFRLRHELLTVRTMAAQTREVYARVSSLARFLPADAVPFVEDVVDRVDRVRSLCDDEKDFLQGVVDFYQSRTATKMNIAMERLALISAVVLPVTAVASIYGMNVIVNEQTNPVHVAGVLAAMLAMSALILRWARRHGWL
jgi:magnesium transporter